MPQLNAPQDQPSKAEQEAEELISNLLQAKPFVKADAAPEYEGVFPIGSKAARTLNCVAIVRNGKIMPIVALEGVPEPQTAGEKMHLLALTAKTIMDGLMDALLFWEERRRQQRNDGEAHV